MNFVREKRPRRTGDVVELQDNETSRVPGQRDPERTQRAILEAATMEFANKGFDGASVNEIAAAAKVNKRMLYHYFGKKEDLYLVVLERAYVNLRNAQTRLDLSKTEPNKAIESYIRFTWDYLIKRPEFLRLFSGENLMRARYLRRSKCIGELHKPIISMLADILRRGAAQGLFRRDVDPLQLHISIVSLIYFFLAGRHSLAVIFGNNLDEETGLTLRGEVIVDFVQGYLRP